MTTPNCANRTMRAGDNLDIMRGMNAESGDLVYPDPPFNSNRNFTAPVDGQAVGAASITDPRKSTEMYVDPNEEEEALLWEPDGGPLSSENYQLSNDPASPLCAQAFNPGFFAFAKVSPSGTGGGRT